MQLEETFELPFPRDRVWGAFEDIPMLVSCLPGAALTSGADADPFALVFAVKLGPISAKFSGEGSVAYADDFTGRLTGSGADRATNSRVKGEAKFALHDIGSGTRVGISVDYTLTGALAQFGRPGIVRELASGITQQFAANLRSKLGEVAPAAAVPVESVGAARVPAIALAPEAEELSSPVAVPAQLDAGRLLWRILWARVKRMFGAH